MFTFCFNSKLADLLAAIERPLPSVVEEQDDMAALSIEPASSYNYSPESPKISVKSSFLEAVQIQKKQVSKMEKDPQWDLLAADEQKLCQQHRIRPSSYLNAKQLMVQHAFNHGLFAMGQTRNIVPIPRGMGTQHIPTIWNFLMQHQLPSAAKEGGHSSDTSVLVSKRRRHVRSNHQQQW